MCDFRTPLKKTRAKNVVGPSIKRIRAAAEPKVSQQDLAGRLAALGVQIDRSAIARLERGDRFIRDFEIIGIAAALRVPLVQLFPK
jgi:transcriptional regulator with XRE-family HTH domain